MDHTHGPTPQLMLLAVLNTEEIMTQIEAWCRQQWKPYPIGGSALFFWRVCWAAGIAVPYLADTDRFLYAAQRANWQVVPATEAPEAGDIAVWGTGRAGLAAEFVIKPVTGQAAYIGIGAGVPKGRREGQGGAYHSPVAPVAFWLRHHCLECEQRRLALAERPALAHEAASA
jgi:hypothetical protein